MRWRSSIVKRTANVLYIVRKKKGVFLLSRQKDFRV